MDLNGKVAGEILILLAFVAAIVYVLFETSRRRPKRWKPSAGPVTDAAEQLRNVMAANFTVRRVMSAAEYRVFQVVEAEVLSARNGHRVFAQTSLGEVLQSNSTLGFSAINSKRADILVIGPSGLPRLAIEYQGEGHFQGSAAARDAVKKEALRKAGVAYLEIHPTHSVDQIRSLVRRALNPASLMPRPVERSGDAASPVTPLR